MPTSNDPSVNLSVNDSDSNSSMNPYQAMNLLWQTISPYLIQKYNVEFSSAFPNGPITKNTIVWNIVRRTPGSDGSDMNKKGANYTKFVRYTNDGRTISAWSQRQTMLVEFNVYGVNTGILDELAWDLEVAIGEATGTMQDKIEGYTCVFVQQTMSSSMLYRQQDELLKKVIQFSIMMPVMYLRSERTLRNILLNKSVGNIPESISTTRQSSSTTFYIPIELPQSVCSINVVSIPAASGTGSDWMPLLYGTDYKIAKDSNQVMYILWNDANGNTPPVGGQIRIDYSVKQLLEQTNIV